MADFRRWLYVLALVTLLAGFTVPVSAQNAPLECIANAGVPPTVRAEGWTELLGDITLNCTGGIPTPATKVVQPVNVTVTINTYLTSKILSSSGFNEALLIVDEPHSAVNPGRPILNCGAAGAPEESGAGGSGAGVCAITSDGNPVDTYNGTTGHPNVFQGQQGTPAVQGQPNAVTWLGVPLDPPGTTTNRTIRITNLRADAHDANGSAAPGNFVASYITAQISINGNTSLSINNPQQIVAFIGPGLIAGISATNFSFLQCVGAPPESPVPAFTWTEGFASSWKVKNISLILNQQVGTVAGNGTFPGTAYWIYDGDTAIANGTVNYPADLNQNVPGAIYNTESGFEYPGTMGGTNVLSDPTINPPPGLGTVPVTIATQGLWDATTGIQGAGIANTGTRLQMQISNIPAGATVTVPDAILLTNQGGHQTSGIAMLVNTDSAGAGAYSPVYTGTGGASGALGTSSTVASSGLVVYEVIWADPFSVESATVQTTVSYSPSLNLNQPTPNQIAQAFGGFAPFYSTAAAHLPSSTMTIPRFVTAQIPSNVNYFEIVRCACNLLFPFVTNAGGYDTGIAIANTSQDNLGATGGSLANPQFGGVEFWYYGTTASGGAAPGTQCTNVASPGTCPTPNATSSSSAIGQVPAGQLLTYVLSTSGGSIGNGPNGLAPNWAAGFQGYIIAQAQFQYCHAYAFITAAGAGPLSTSISEGYLGLVLDNKSFNCNMTQLINGNIVNGGGLCRTNQNAENLMH